jgi:hypothetical protein
VKNMAATREINITLPGDMLVALRSMRAWENDDERGYAGPWVSVGGTAIVLQVWYTGNHVRLRLLTDNAISVFSCVRRNFSINWEKHRWSNA